MTLNEFFELYKSSKPVSVEVRDDLCSPYEVTLDDCPAHLLKNEVVKLQVFCDQQIVCTQRPEPESMTWRQVFEAIKAMPEWAKDTQAVVHDRNCDCNYGLSEFLTYYGKEPSEIVDDGQDFAFLALDEEHRW